MLENSQKPHIMAANQKNNNQTDTISPTTPPLDATFSQTSNFSQSRTTRRLRLQPVTPYLTHIPQSKIYIHSG